MKRLIYLLILIALIAGGYYGYTLYEEQKAAEEISSLNTVPATRGRLTATVGATGVVHTNQTAVLAWQTSGSVADISVKVGDRVTADQVLARLAPASLPQNVILAQVELSEAQKALEELNDTEFALAQAELALANAQDAIRNKEYRVDSLGQPARQVDIDSAKANVLLAEIQLNKARKQYEPWENKPENNIMRATYFNKLAEAQQIYDGAVRRLNNLQGTPSDITRSVADADLTLALANVAEAQREVDRLKAGADPDDVAALEARITAAQATLNLARLTAPFAATVTEILVQPGDQVTPGTVAFRLDDFSQLLVDVTISEVDINRVQIGQEVLLTFDAILAKEYRGQVTEVAQVGAANQGVVDFKVTVQLREFDAAVKPGMTAAVNIVISQLEDVLLVPNRAVRVVDGRRVVYVLRDDEVTEIEITLGASSDTNSEVVEGDLSEGDAIVLNPPSTFDSGGPGFMR